MRNEEAAEFFLKRPRHTPCYAGHTFLLNRLKRFYRFNNGYNTFYPDFSIGIVVINIDHRRTVARCEIFPVSAVWRPSAMSAWPGILPGLKNNRHSFPACRVPRFADPQVFKFCPGKQFPPAFHGAKVPGSGFDKFSANTLPASRSPAIRIILLATGFYRV